MDKALGDFVYEELCPDGIWRLPDIVQSLLRYHIARLPKREVSKTDTRYPIDRPSMRAFLKVFFSRHYFQVQNSLIDYIIPEDFLDAVGSGHLRILDVGSGPAVASLAITALLRCVLEGVIHLGYWPKARVVKVTYLLNDISPICLGTGQRMLADYFSLSTSSGSPVAHNLTISMREAFPDNMYKIRWIARSLGGYDMTVLSYVVMPLGEDSGLNALANGLLSIEQLCSGTGRILLVQDKYNESFMRRLGKAIGVSVHKQELTQEIYPDRNSYETYTYTYYSCLYGPIVRAMCEQYRPVSRSPYHAVALT